MLLTSKLLLVQQRNAERCPTWQLPAILALLVFVLFFKYENISVDGDLVNRPCLLNYYYYYTHARAHWHTLSSKTCGAGGRFAVDEKRTTTDSCDW